MHNRNSKTAWFAGRFFLWKKLVAFALRRDTFRVRHIFILGAALLGTEGRQDWKSASFVRRGLALAGVAGLIVCLGLDYESVLTSSGR